MSFLELRCLKAFLFLFGDVGCPPLTLRNGFSFKGTWLYWISSQEQIGSHLHVSSFVGLVATRTPTTNQT
uniref:Secreted protein n=1 Tax=Oryza brachyantha TaxID=4533 RepID=J3NA29_ORYBR